MSTTSRRVATWAAVVTALLILFSTTVDEFYDGGLGKLASDIAGSPSAVIESPNQLAVPHKVPTSGSYDNVPTTSKVWAVLQDVSTNRLYPAAEPCWTDGDRFSCGTLTVGADNSSGETMNILITTADADAVAAYNRYQTEKGGPYGANPGLGDLPDGADVIASHTVVRSNR